MSSTEVAFRDAIIDLHSARFERLDSATMRERKADLDAACTAYVEELAAVEEAERVEADDADLDFEALVLFNVRNGTTEPALVAGTIRDDWRDVARAARRMYGAEAKPVTLTTAEELDALPAGSVVKARYGTPWQKTEAGYWAGKYEVYLSPDLLAFASLTLASVPEASA